jgi:hypothetical protein
MTVVALVNGVLYREYDCDLTACARIDGLGSTVVVGTVVLSSSSYGASPPGVAGERR